MWNILFIQITYTYPGVKLQNFRRPFWITIHLNGVYTRFYGHIFINAY